MEISRRGYSGHVSRGSIATESPRQGITLLRVSGEHDLYTAPDLRDRLKESLAAGHVVVDLSDATFVDSSILGALLGARQRAHEDGRGFAVSMSDSASKTVRQVFEITGLIPAMPVLASVEEAMEAMNQQHGAPHEAGT
jgi:anti-sigma B factor antagonist